MNEIDLKTLSPIAILPEPAERVRLRETFGVTQIALAASLHVSRKTISRWETGSTEPQGKNREEYAAILNAWTETEKADR